MGGIAYGIGDWWRRLNQNSRNEQADDPIGDLWNPIKNYGAGLSDSFNAGLNDLPDPQREGQLSALRNMGQQPPAQTAPVAATPPPAAPQEEMGIDPREAAAALSRGLQRREMSSPGSVKVSFGGKEYDYSNGASGGAPTLGGIGNGLGKQWGTEPSDQTLEWSQPGIGHGVASQMTANPSMASIGQLRDERELADAQPTGDPLGYTRGDMRTLDSGIRTRMADEMGRGQAQVGVESAKSGLRIQEQENRRQAYEQAVTEEESSYQRAVQAITASALPPEEKQRRLGEAQSRFDAQRQTVKEAFGFGSNLGAAMRSEP